MDALRALVTAFLLAQSKLAGQGGNASARSLGDSFDSFGHLSLAISSVKSALFFDIKIFCVSSDNN